MINKAASTLLLLVFSLAAFSQSSETTKSSARPDIPGVFTLELGLNRALNAPENFTTGLWGSRSINIYYQYEMRIMNSKFSFIPGVGLSLERFKFRNGQVISYPHEGGVYTNPVANTDSVVLFALGQHGIPGLKKSQLITNYVEVPLEFRYTLNPDDPARSFHISLGGRIGYLYDGFSKLKYKEDGEVKQLKDKQLYNLNRFRYGVFAKLGFGSFSFFGYYNLSPMFKTDEGFYDKGLPNNDMNTFTAGISLSSF